MRLLLMSDITPVPLTAGPLLLYRHFKRMQEHQILVISGVIPEPDPPDRHWSVHRLPRRLKLLRRPWLAPLFEELHARIVLHQTWREIQNWDPDIVLSVWSTEYLIAASCAATRLGRPLALICHDDLEGMLHPARYVQQWARWRLKHVYRQAAVRFCVSEGMEQLYTERYGAPGTTLHPIGSQNPKTTLRAERAGNKVKYGYAGRISAGEAIALGKLAETLAKEGDILEIASPSAGQHLKSLLTAPSVRYIGLLSPEDTRKHFTTQVDVMVVVQSFLETEEIMIRTNFPSKLGEAVQYGLPIIVIAPVYGSASTWASQHPNALVSVRSLAEEPIKTAVRRLRSSELRLKLTTEMAETGAKELSPSIIHERFETQLKSACFRPGKAR